jgi:hypothetical protein
MSGINKNFSREIKPCQFCGAIRLKCPCARRCPHSHHTKDRKGNPQLRHLCPGCWEAFPHSERVWNKNLQRFVAPNDPSLVSVVPKVEPKVQAVELGPITDELWDFLNQMVDEDIEAGGEAGGEARGEAGGEADVEARGEAGGEADVEAGGDADSERILTQIMWGYFDEIRRSERQQAQDQAEQMSPEEVERLERLFNEANSDDE